MFLEENELRDKILKDTSLGEKYLWWVRNKYFLNSTILDQVVIAKANDLNLQQEFIKETANQNQERDLVVEKIVRFENHKSYDEHPSVLGDEVENIDQ